MLGESVMKRILPLVLLALIGSSVAAPPQEQSELAIEQRIVQYLKQHVRPGEPLSVTELYNNVFKTPEEQKVLSRLFNTFFKIPLFVAQYKAGTGRTPTLADISHQFNFQVEGEAAVLLSVMDNDPRIPKFINRDPKSGEITAVDVEAVKNDRRFGQVLERTLSGWSGKQAPPFTLDLFDGKTIASETLKGRGYLIYFWFYGCPPCIKIAPELANLQRRFGSKDFTVLGVNADRFLELETSDAQRADYVKKAGFTFLLAHLNKKMQEDYGSVSVYPTLFLVDSGGVIKKYYVGYQSFDTLAHDVEGLLGTRPQ
jgi:thiol-disulfide isomerase/thioredoxin